MPYKDPEAQKEHNRKYREAHREDAIAYAKAYREANPEKMAEYKREWANKEGRQAITERRREYHRKRYQENREVLLERQRQYRAANPERATNRQLKEKFGITLEQKKARIISQDHKCMICRAPINCTTGHMDHRHDPFLLRDVLCGNCNWGLGNFKDNPVLLEKAAAYLRLHS